MYVYVLTSVKHMQCSDNRGACRYVYGVQEYIYIRMKLGGSGGMPLQGKFAFLGEIMYLRPF